MIVIINLATGSKDQEVNDAFKLTHSNYTLGTPMFNDRDEMLPRRVYFLLFSLGWHKFKENKRAYKNVSREIKEIGDKIQVDGGIECWLRIKEGV